MSLETTSISNIQCGRQPVPPRIFLYGREGIGKSQLCAQAPKPIYIPTEDGLGQIDCHRFPLAKSLDDVTAALNVLYADAHDYQTVVVDSVDWLERLVWDRVCQDFGCKSIEKVDGGYGRGYMHALVYWRKLLDALIVLHADRQMIVLLISHAKVERFEDPESSAYDRYSPRLHKHACSLLTEWVDAVLFATSKFRVEAQSGGFNRERGVAHAVGKDGGERILRTIGGPACVAKNRYSLPAELPLAWSPLFDAIISNATAAALS